MYCGGGSFTSFTAQVLHKKFPLLPSCSDSTLSGPRPVLWYTGSFTVSPGSSLVPSVAPDWNPGWTPNLLHHLALPGAVDETLIPSPISAHPAQILQDSALVDEGTACAGVTVSTQPVTRTVQPHACCSLKLTTTATSQGPSPQPTTN